MGAIDGSQIGLDQFECGAQDTPLHGGMQGLKSGHVEE